MRSHLVTRFTLLLVTLLGALVAVQLADVSAQRSADRAAVTKVALTRDVEQIRYYDELLTMSARLAAASGDTAYVDRYRRAVPRLERVIRHARALVPDPAADRAVQSTTRANEELIALETESFRLVAAGRRAAAYDVLTTDAYAAYKVEYRRGMEKVVRRLEQASARQHRQAAARRHLGMIAGIGAAMLLALLSAGTARGLHRSQQARALVEEHLRTQAESDPLTGLANRRLFRERLTSALDNASAAGPPAVLFADLDQFKDVNDSRGHAAGDAVLVEAADRISALVRDQPAALLARLGGDEFAVLLTNTDEAAASLLAGQVVDVLALPYPSAPHVPITASVGLAIAEPGAHDPSALLRGADLAMYDAKAHPSGTWRRYADHLHPDLSAHQD